MISTSSKIRVLPPGVAERIAAGEVVERPASVVKELVENSLDAGATEVAVILQTGGKAAIEIFDNGHGMGPEDLRLCAKRHATSKLGSLEDLERIRTLGFRGEALPSIAAVSDLSILSRARDSESAYELRAGQPGATEDRVEAVTFGHFLGSPHGTRILSQGLFAQVPARLKFMKSQAAEVSQVRDWLERLALTHPHVGFKLVSDDRTILQLRPQSEQERVRTILADGEDFPILTAEGSIPGLKLRVHWLQGLSAAQPRKLVQIVNLRAVKDRMLQQALLAPFRQALLPGQYPALALFIEAEPIMIDVNVHPAKSEIRFLDGSKVFRAISSALERLIEENGAIGFASGSHHPWSAGENRASAHFSAPPSSTRSLFASALGSSHTPAAGELFSRQGIAWHESDSTEGATPGASTLDPAPPRHPLAGAAFSGSLFNTYLLFDLGEELGMVDQHAAHERIRYEKLKKRSLEQTLTPSQALLQPEVVPFPAEAQATVHERLGWLTQMGFDADSFGEDSLVFRGVPAEWGHSQLRPRLKSLVERLIAEDSDGSLALDELLFERLASEACHSAIRAGDRLERKEVQQLVEDLFECEHPWNCPHGRPTVVRVPRARFEEWFQRRV